MSSTHGSSINRTASAEVSHKFRISLEDVRPGQAGHRPAAKGQRDHRRENAPLNRLTYFDLGSGRTISSFTPIIGEDWRGVWRNGGAIMAMDLDGSERFQLW